MLLFLIFWLYESELGSELFNVMSFQLREEVKLTSEGKTEGRLPREVLKYTIYVIHLRKRLVWKDKERLSAGSSRVTGKFRGFLRTPVFLPPKSRSLD